MNKILNSTSFSLFMNIAKQHNLWFSLANNTLNRIVHENQTYFSGKIEVFMNINSYLKLQRIAPQNILDSYLNSTYKSPLARFFTTPQTSLDINDYVEIYLLVPTSLIKIDYHKSLENKISSLNGYYETFKEQISKKMKAWKPLYWLTNYFYPAKNYKHLIDILFTHEHEGYIVLDWPWKDVQNRWFSNVSFDLKYEKVDGIDLPILIEYEVLLCEEFQDPLEEEKDN